MSSSLPIDPSASMKAAQDQEMVRRKMEIDAMRKHLSPGPDQKEKLQDACQGFESVFIQKLWEQMRKNVPQEGYLHSKQEAMYQSMYDQEFSKKMAEAGGIGLADMLYEQLAQSLGESSRTVSTGINTALPRVSATASPSSMKYAAAGGQTTEIKPLYEDVDETAPLAQRKFELGGADPRQGYALQRNRFAPQPAEGLVEGLDESMLGDGLGKIPENPAGGFLTQATGDDLDFESISQAMLADELQGGQAEAAEEPVARAPISVYAQAFNRRHSSGVLSAEQKRILDDAVSENLRAVSLARGAASTTASAVQGADASRGRG
ncbi:rod-binding protein [Desulfovibrio sp. OttesenSCG-928-C06]|nr:rod-binding protein [Desulfovibrio sp. OttesenSCG-928-C06]